MRNREGYNASLMSTMEDIKEHTDYATGLL